MRYWKDFQLINYYGYYSFDATWVTISSYLHRFFTLACWCYSKSAIDMLFSFSSKFSSTITFIISFLASREAFSAINSFKFLAIFWKFLAIDIFFRMHQCCAEEIPACASIGVFSLCRLGLILLFGGYCCILHFPPLMPLSPLIFFSLTHGFKCLKNSKIFKCNKISWFNLFNYFPLIALICWWQKLNH